MESGWVGKVRQWWKATKTTELWNAMWPEDPPHTRTHTPSRVWEKLFRLFRSSAGGKRHMCSVDILAPIEYYLDKKELNWSTYCCSKSILRASFSWISWVTWAFRCSSLVWANEIASFLEFISSFNTRTSCSWVSLSSFVKDSVSCSLEQWKIKTCLGRLVSQWSICYMYSCGKWVNWSSLNLKMLV